MPFIQSLRKYSWFSLFKNLEFDFFKFTLVLLSLAHATVLSCLKYSNNFLTASPCKQILFQFFALPVSFITEELAWPAKHESWWSLMKPQPANTYQWFHKACALNSKVLFFDLKDLVLCVSVYISFFVVYSCLLCLLYSTYTGLLGSWTFLILTHLKALTVLMPSQPWTVFTEIFVTFAPFISVWFPFTG